MLRGHFVLNRDREMHPLMSDLSSTANTSDTPQGYAALLNVYARQYRAQVTTELTSVRVHYRTADNIDMLDQDINALAQVCTQVDALLAEGNDGSQAIYAKVQMLSALAGANFGAIKSYMPMIQIADLRYIDGPNVMVLDQARLKASAKRLMDTDNYFLTNFESVIAQVQNALAVVFPKPPPLPDPIPEADPASTLDSDHTSEKDEHLKEQHAVDLDIPDDDAEPAILLPDQSGEPAEVFIAAEHDTQHDVPVSEI